MKHQGSIASNEHPLKRRCLTPCDDNNSDMKWVQHEIASIKKTLEEMVSEAREDRDRIISMFEELDVAGIKESLDNMTYDAREERENIHSMLAELLAKVQWDHTV